MLVYFFRRMHVRDIAASGRWSVDVDQEISLNGDVSLEAVGIAFSRAPGAGSNGALA